jgi:hypothetical protein
MSVSRRDFSAPGAAAAAGLALRTWHFALPVMTLRDRSAHPQSLCRTTVIISTATASPPIRTGSRGPFAYDMLVKARSLDAIVAVSDVGLNPRQALVSVFR